MLRKLYKENQMDISLPLQIKALFEKQLEDSVGLMDYDYSGIAKEVDYTSFASNVYDMFGSDSHFVLVMHSDEMKNTRLLMKTFKFDLTCYDFSRKIETWSTPLDDTSVVFIGIVSIETFEDFRLAVKFLFSGIYDSQNFMMLSRRALDIKHLKTILNKSLDFNRNRYGDIQNVYISMSKLIHHKECIKILYPYGGTDFGSFMFFIL